MGKRGVRVGESCTRTAEDGGGTETKCACEGTTSRDRVRLPCKRWVRDLHTRMAGDATDG